MPEKKHFFISYTQADRSWAEWIGWQLEEEKFGVILQAWDFAPGINFLERMDEALMRDLFTQNCRISATGRKGVLQIGSPLLRTGQVKFEHCNRSL